MIAHFVTTDGDVRSLEIANGLSLMEGARSSGIHIEGRCEGSLACSTCHVIIEAKWFERVGEPSLDELDMLDLVTVGFSPTSRLCCQIIASPELDGIVVRLPAKRREA